MPVCELGSTGSVTAVNTFGANGLISRHTSSVDQTYTFDPSGNVSEITASDSSYGKKARRTVSAGLFGLASAGGII